MSREGRLDGGGSLGRRGKRRMGGREVEEGDLGRGEGGRLAATTRCWGEKDLQPSFPRRASESEVEPKPPTQPGEPLLPSESLALNHAIEEGQATSEITP
mgnify:CR=1 FL=1